MLQFAKHFKAIEYINKQIKNMKLLQTCLQKVSAYLKTPPSVFSESENSTHGVLQIFFFSKKTPPRAFCREKFSSKLHPKRFVEENLSQNSTQSILKTFFSLKTPPGTFCRKKIPPKLHPERFVGKKKIFLIENSTQNVLQIENSTQLSQNSTRPRSGPDRFLQAWFEQMMEM